MTPATWSAARDEAMHTHRMLGAVLLVMTGLLLAGITGAIYHHQEQPWTTTTSSQQANTATTQHSKLPTTTRSAATTTRPSSASTGKSSSTPTDRGTTTADVIWAALIGGVVILAVRAAMRVDEQRKAEGRK